jgi:predicted phosphodiesterase
MRRALWFPVFAGLLVVLGVISMQGRRTASVALLQTPPGTGTQSPPAQSEVPASPPSIRFAVIGDMGTGDRPQYDVADQMTKAHATFPFNFAIMLGDNLYGGNSPADYAKKFERPYKTLLDAGVKFYASLGNHDNSNERFYEPFNMAGQRYYTFKIGNVAFFALDSNYMDPEQLAWVEGRLKAADSAWKICFFHHPLYSDGKTHGPDLDLRNRIEPLFMKYGVDAVFSGHEHVYERLQQHDIYYFIEGNSGELRLGNLRPSAQMIKGFDTDRAFMLVEIAGDELRFKTISRTGQLVDSGTLMNH